MENLITLKNAPIPEGTILHENFVEDPSTKEILQEIRFGLIKINLRNISQDIGEKEVIPGTSLIFGMSKRAFVKNQNLTGLEINKIASLISRTLTIYNYLSYLPIVVKETSSVINKNRILLSDLGSTMAEINNQIGVIVERLGNSQREKTLEAISLLKELEDLGVPLIEDYSINFCILVKNSRKTLEDKIRRNDAFIYI